jgi:TonB family protein
VADFSKCAKPAWPVEALRREQQGRVTLAYRIGADGSVEESKVTKSSGYPLLDEAARFGLAKCTFKPATVNGKPQSAWMQMQYVWTLEQGASDPASQAAFAETRAAAEAGDVDAQRNLGEMYQQGKGVARDAAQALAWLTKAAEAGNAEAQFGVASFYLASGSGAVSGADAHQWLLKAAEQGHAMAMVGLSAQYSMGKGVDKDPVQAFAWMRKAADAGVPRAFAGLGWMYQTGQGVEPDPVEAVRMLRRGVELGDQAAVQGLALALNQSHAPRDHEEAVALLLKGAEKGNPVMQTLLGKAYRDGRGATADAAAAAEWFRKAAAQSYTEAQFAYAEALELGVGVRKDDAEAPRLYELAARAGWPAALQRMLAVAERGELGRPVDVAAAAMLRSRLGAAGGSR